MTSYGDRVDFFAFHDDKIMYDERKKRFVATKDMPGHMARQYYSSSFKTVSLFHINHRCILYNFKATLYSHHLFLFSIAKTRSDRL